MSDVLPEIEILKECGPVYGTVQLLRSLPLSNVGMSQAMPNEKDLSWAFNGGHQRLAAGYEVLLHHYYKLRKAISDMQEKCKTAEICVYLVPDIESALTNLEASASPRSPSKHRDDKRFKALGCKVFDNDAGTGVTEMIAIATSNDVAETIATAMNQYCAGIC